MIFKSFEFKKIDIKKHNFYLFYGENNGLKKEIIEVNFRKLFKDKTYNYEENSILQNQKKFGWYKHKTRISEKTTYKNR